MALRTGLVGLATGSEFGAVPGLGEALVFGPWSSLDQRRGLVVKRSSYVSRALVALLDTSSSVEQST